MTIASEITRINNNIANAYTTIANKGGTIPATQNSANLATAINSIPSGSSATTPRFLKCTLTSSDFEVDDYGDLDPSEVDDFVSTLVINVILDLETTAYGRILWLPDLQSIGEEIYSDLLDVFEYECYCNSYTDSVGTSNILVGYEMLDSAFTLYSTIDGVYFFKNTSVPYLAEGTVLSIRSGTMVDQDGYSFSPFTIRLTANKFFTPAT